MHLTQSERELERCQCGERSRMDYCGRKEPGQETQPFEESKLEE